MTVHLETVSTAHTTFPIEVHIFESQGDHYAFDVRNYAILKVDAAGAAVLSKMRQLPLDAIIETCASDIPADIVRLHYLKFLRLIQGGILSVHPVARPARPPFNHLVLMLAGGCNMGCTYCFEKDVPIYQNPNLMTREKAEEILDWFFKHQEGKTAHIQFYGGEALLNWPILQYVVERAETWAQNNEIELTKYLITNGTLLKPERIAYLKDHQVSIQVSVDGDAETHNRFRILKSGKPTMDRIKPNIIELSRQKADFNLRAVLTRQSKGPKEVMEQLRALGGEQVSFDVVTTDQKDAQLTAEDWEKFNTNYATFVHGSYKEWKALPADVQSTIMGILQGNHFFYGCGAGISEVTVSPDGSIYECQRIYRNPYATISEDKSPTELASTLLTMVDDRPICQDCWARYLCGGGCMHQSHVGHGSDDPLPPYCTMKRHQVEAAIVKIDQIRSRKIQVSPDGANDQ